MKQECDQLMTKPLDMSSQEIVRDLHQANKDIKTIVQSIELFQIEHTEVKKDIKILKSDHESLKKSHDLLQGDSVKTRTVLKELASMQEGYVPRNRRGIQFILLYVYMLKICYDYIVLTVDL